MTHVPKYLWPTVACLVWIIIPLWTVQGATLNIAWFAPKKFYYAFNASTSVGALVAAIEKIQADSTLLPGYTIDVRLQDSDCNSRQGIGVAYDIMTSSFKPDIFIGPACSPAMSPVAQLASYMNMPVFGWISSDPLVEQKAGKHSTLVNLLRPIATMGEGFILIFKLLGWRRVFIISAGGADYGEMGDGVRKAFSDKASEGFVVARWVQDVKEKASVEAIQTIYGNVKLEARVVILCVPDDEVRNYMIAAYNENMWQGEYVFFFTSQRILDESSYNELRNTTYWKLNDGNDEAAMKAYANLFVFTTKTLDLQQVKQYQQNFYAAALKAPWPTKLISPVHSDLYSLFLYDAAMLFAKVATQAGNVTDGELLFNTAKGKHWGSGATGDIILNENGDRSPDFWLFNMQDDGTYHIVAESISTRLADGSVNRTINSILPFRWGNGKLGFENRPQDVPTCGFQNEKCPDLVLYIVPAVVSFVVLLVVISAICIYRRMAYERTLHSMAWKIVYSDLNFYFGNKGVGSHMNFRSMSTNLRRSRGKSIGSESIADSTAGQLFITVATYKGAVVAIKNVRKNKIKMDRGQLTEMKNMTSVKHNNMATLIGACIDTPYICAVWEYCSKGSLQDVIWNENINLDDMFKFSICMDLLKGLVYLHNSNLKVHGRLKSSNVLIDGRWVCKLTDYGLRKFTAGEEEDAELSDHASYSRMFWTAPEHLRGLTNSKAAAPCSHAGDIYSTAVIMKEIFCRNGPYTEAEDVSPQDIVEKVTYPKDGKYFRPVLDEAELSDDLKETIVSAWAENPEDRPSASQLLKTITKANPFKKSNVMDNMIAMMEKYSNHLEEIVADRTVQLEEEKKKTETLLYRMLPRSIAEDLKVGKPIKAEAFESVTIYFSDIVSFTNLAAESTPMQVVDLLNSLYTLFDETISRHDVYKVETIGDAYMLVSGLPMRNGDRHVVEISNCAMDLLSGALTFIVPHKPDYKLRIRIGIHTGSAVAGVVGLTMPRYCLFGDTVNTASRMESNGLPLRIHLSPTTYEGLSKFSGYYVADRGAIEVKGKGRMQTYWLVGRENYDSRLPDFHRLTKEDSPKPTFLPVSSGKPINVVSERPSTESGFSEPDHLTTDTQRKAPTPGSEIKLADLDWGIHGLPPVEESPQTNGSVKQLEATAEVEKQTHEEDKVVHIEPHHVSLVNRPATVADGRPVSAGPPKARTAFK